MVITIQTHKGEGIILQSVKHDRIGKAMIADQANRSC